MPGIDGGERKKGDLLHTRKKGKFHVTICAPGVWEKKKNQKSIMKKAVAYNPPRSGGEFTFSRRNEPPPRRTYKEWEGVDEKKVRPPGKGITCAVGQATPAHGVKEKTPFSCVVERGQSRKG